MIFGKKTAANLRALSDSEFARLKALLAQREPQPEPRHRVVLAAAIARIEKRLSGEPPAAEDDRPEPDRFFIPSPAHLELERRINAIRARLRNAPGTASSPAPVPEPSPTLESAVPEPAEADGQSGPKPEPKAEPVAEPPVRVANVVQFRPWGKCFHSGGNRYWCGGET